MKELFKCIFCEKAIDKNEELFILKEDIEDWDSDANTAKIIKEGTAVCIECLIEYIEDTERVPITLPQIEYRYINVKNVSDSI